jgi:hypothetical protein
MERLKRHSAANGRPSRSVEKVVSPGTIIVKGKTMADQKIENPAEKETLDIAAFLKDRSPIKLVTGTQTSQGLTFNLEPGAIVAHPNSAVLFVCG